MTNCIEGALRVAKQVSSQASKNTEAPSLVVGIAATASGHSELATILSAMGVDTGITLVILLSSAGAVDIHATETLKRISSLPVFDVLPGTPLRSGCVYIASLEKRISLSGGLFAVSSVQNRDEELAGVDAFFHDIATEFTLRSAGIVLSGHGEQGSLGLMSISEAGGMTIVQAADTAEHPAMPRNAVSRGAVDHILSPQEIAPELLRYELHITKVADQDVLNDLIEQITASLPSICDVLQKSTSHDFKHYKTSTLVRRIQRRMQVLQILSVDAYIERLSNRTEEVDALFKELLINVTGFFRDPEAFAILRDAVLQKLARRGGGPDQKLRVWVAGCSTGEEAYTLGMLLQEALDSEVGKPQVLIIATDIDEAALAVARKGAYPITIAENVSADRLKRFFVRKGGRYHVSKELREMCLFSCHNLINDPPFSQLDLITCRNVLIYLGSHLQKKLIPVFHYALRPGGYLFLGTSESLSSHKELFRTVNTRYRIAQRKATSIRSAVTEHGSFSSSPASSTHSSSQTHEADIHFISQRILLDEFAPRYAVVNDEGQIVSVSSGIGAYLEPVEGPFQNSIVRLVKSTLRSALRNAFNEARRRKRTIKHDRASLACDDGLHRIEIIVQPMPKLGDNSELYMTVFRDLGVVLATGVPGPKRDPLRVQEDDAHVEQLEHELRAVREDLEKTVHELEASNEELKSSNEELLSMNEELQSANEELESSKEEVQTVNDALQQANNDLENLLASTDVATLFLDSDLCIRNFTPNLQKLYNVRKSDIGRPIGDFTHNADFMPPYVQPVKIQTHALAGAADGTVMLASDAEIVANGRTFLRRVTPYRTHEGLLSGIVASFVDITDLLQAGDALKESERKFRQLAETMPQLVWTAEADGSVSYLNARWYAYTGQTHDKIGAWNWLDAVHPDDRAHALSKWNSAVARGDEYRTEYRIRSASGEDRWFLGWGTPLHDEDGRILQWFGTFTDIEKEKVLREEQELLRESLAEAKQGAEEASAAKTDFLANMSHEIRTPLGAITGYADLLSENTSLDEETRSFVECITRNSRQLCHLIDDLLDLTKIEAGKLAIETETFDAGMLIDEALSVVTLKARDKGLSLRALWESDVPRTFTSDPHRVRQVLVNLLGNAVKFTERGHVQVSARIFLDAGCPTLEVTVSDSGVGMNDEQKRFLFEPFSQGTGGIARRYGGTGLGLALSRKLVRLLDGEVNLVRSDPGEGSVFRFFVRDLARTGQSVVAGAAVGFSPDGTEGTNGVPGPGRVEGVLRTQAPKLPLSNRHILLIDDLADNLVIGSKHLSSAGALVTVLSSGLEAGALTNLLEFDAVVTDLMMPEFDGFQTLAALRGSGYQGPVVALTAHALKGDRERCLEAGFVEHLPKPVSRHMLVQTLARLIAQNVTNPKDA